MDSTIRQRSHGTRIHTRVHGESAAEDNDITALEKLTQSVS